MQAQPYRHVNERGTEKPERTLLSRENKKKLRTSNYRQKFR